MEKLQEMADAITNECMSRLYGERFANSDDITEDEEMSSDWDAINAVAYDKLVDAFNLGRSSK